MGLHRYFHLKRFEIETYSTNNYVKIKLRNVHYSSLKMPAHHTKTLKDPISFYLFIAFNRSLIPIMKEIAYMAQFPHL